jgi:hypothetical protein
MSINLTMVLTTVAFKWYVAEHLYNIQCSEIFTLINE